MSATPNAPRRMDPRTADKLDTQARVLTLVAAGATLVEAGRAVGVVAGSISHWRSREPAFAARLDAAKRAGGTVRTERRRATAARVFQAVRAGRPLRDACREHGVTPVTLRGWCARAPELRAALDRATRDARAHDPRKLIVLDAIATGANVTEACRRAGVRDNSVRDWRQADPEFAAAYARMAGPTGYPSTVRKLSRIVARIERGETVWNAAVAERIGKGAVRLWYWTHPELWDRIAAAYHRTGRPAPEPKTGTRPRRKERAA